MKNILIFLLLLSCSGTDRNYIMQRTWSYEAGVKITDGDFLDFQNKVKYCELSNDTVYINSKARARIIQLNKKENLLYLKTIPEGANSVYYFHNYYE